MIGWREWIEFPELGVDAVKAKVDTGARSSAIHASQLEVSRRRGRDYATFVVHPLQRRTDVEVEVEVEIAEFRSVRSSNGVCEQRPVIHTPVRWGGQLWSIELTLTRRDEMGFRCLLGRQAVRNRFLIDPGRSFCGVEPKKKKKKRP